MTLLQENIWNQLLGTLQDLSDFDSQRRYKKAVPYVHIPLELAAQWENYPRLVKERRAWFIEILSPTQIKAILELETQFQSIQMSEDFPDVEEAFELTEWISLRRAAELTLKHFPNTPKQANKPQQPKCPDRRTNVITTKSLPIVEIDWQQIFSTGGFFDIVLEQCESPSWHGRNLDALQDSWVTGGIDRIGPPYHFRFTAPASAPQALEEFVSTVHEIAHQSIAANGGQLQVIDSDSGHQATGDNA